MRDTSKGIKIVTLIALILFVVFSGFGGFIIVGQFMKVPGDLVGIYSAGDVFVEAKRWGSFSLITALSVLQMILLFVPKRWAQVSGTVLSILSVLVTLLFKPLYEAVAYPSGGLIGYSCQITGLGYAAIVISFLIVFLHICIRKIRIPEAT